MNVYSKKNRIQKEKSACRSWLLSALLFLAFLTGCVSIFLAERFTITNDLLENDRQSGGRDLWGVLADQAKSDKVQVLALLSPPGLLGGYRNQVLRWIAFVVHAVENGYKQIYLPSILWSTQTTGIGFGNQWYQIPMNWIFDVDHWNQFAEHLPLLVSEISDSDCWIIPEGNQSFSVPPSVFTKLHPLQQEALRHGYFRPLQNITTQVQAGLLSIQPRKQDLLPNVANCTHPAAFGGGLGAGKLWNGYLQFIKRKTRSGSKEKHVDEWVYRALQPAPKWRELAVACLPHQHFAVVHARIEIEMMAHTCGRGMERNLTKIMDRVSMVLKDRPEITGLMIAVSRSGLMSNKSYHETYQDYGFYNTAVLDRMVGNLTSKGKGFRLGDRTIDVVECGEKLLAGYYDNHPSVIDHGSLLHSVVNFHLAISADVFFGVAQSSYSTDVLTTRYYTGKGNSSFRYTQTGIETVDGIPAPHSNCKGNKKKRRKKAN